MARIVCIGGGTGLFTLLSGLKERLPEHELAAVVTMMDSGGSSGRLRDEFGYLPPGDVRQCLVALSDAPHELRALMQHRFLPNGADGTQSTLSGHVVGNILLTALKDLTGDEYAAIEAMERILRLRGNVYPVTLTDCHLVARLEDGSFVHGETNIDIPKHDPSLRITALALDPQATIFGRTREALAAADHILIGPGDLYTSVLPNLLVDGVGAAVAEAQARGAKVTIITNTMTKHGETDGFTAKDFLNMYRDALRPASIDCAIVNTGMPPGDRIAAYAEEHAAPVPCDIAHGEDGIVVIADDLLATETFARHHPGKLADAVRRAIERSWVPPED